MLRYLVAFALVAGVFAPCPRLGAAAPPDLPLLLSEDFEKGADRWEVTDGNAWKLVRTPKGSFFSQFQQSKYTPPYRSPLNIALLKDVVVGDFVLTARVQSTARDYPHRDMCLFFGYQDSSHFYYVHLGQRADDHANQIFIVNKAARSKISTRSTEGTRWDNEWHTARIVRRVRDGTIEVYFDDMKVPVMTATDRTFAAGRIGLGSFDDTGNWDDIQLWGLKAPKKSERK
jgi:hypothetical protein